MADVRAVPSGKPEFGDYQCNDAMALAKILKRPPREIARRAVEACPCATCIERIAVDGPGFINLFVKHDWLAGNVAALVGDARRWSWTTAPPTSPSLSISGICARITSGARSTACTDSWGIA